MLRVAMYSYVPHIAMRTLDNSYFNKRKKLYQYPSNKGFSTALFIEFIAIANVS